ncbi:ATP:cob(I)alamin adenosyltransferase [Candidatus Kaiserbacteria bacterium RIFCSPLOWO2_01_FULL_53_17]|uniref:Corrinoid adenosyltransferase n=1 Tax=Candidatus Kaiserbacteria bacterium RIFCSPLOWO2_01_FULL_53_17 TaxID=1798511 RepID=A0A1F6EH29_9BACT|nr:MAG: ATP:cob(I)alamin adenosyltransferase [Candidatus Kaiserbacteria bacterium RIFCSPLOWO2_01_FULL_53_17]
MLYTRKGDGGTTKTLKQKPGERVSKASCSTEALGTLDELNSFLGLCKVKARALKWRVENKKPSELLDQAQQNLFIVQAELAGAEKTIKASKVGEVEVLVDLMEQEMPPIKSFFVSGGTEMGAMFDVARTFARRAERTVIRAVEAGEVKIGQYTKAYLNRLSSLCYALARFSNFKGGAKEEPPTYQ